MTQTNDKLSFQSWTSDFHGFPFQSIRVGGKRARICVVSAPLYADQIRTFRTLKQRGYVMIGISSFGHFPFMHEPDIINNSRSAMLQTEEHKSIMTQIDGWLTCSKDPVLYDVPQLRFSESDCPHLNDATAPKGLVKKYDVIYNAASDGDFHQYHKNWNLAKECFQKMSDAGLTVLVIGRDAPSDFELPGVSYNKYLKWHEFLDRIEESRVMFVPNGSDASPRILTEALCKGTPILVNKHIFGGWKYVNDCTGAFFESADDVIPQLHRVLNASCTPRQWFLDTYYPDGESAQLKELKRFIESICNGAIPLEEKTDELTEYAYALNLPAIDMHDVQFIYVSVDTDDHISLCRHDLLAHTDTLNVKFKTYLNPHHWVVWPYYKSTGWGDKQVFKDLTVATTSFSYTLTLPAIDMHDVQFINVSIDTDANHTLWRNDLTAYADTVSATFSTHLTPHHWVVWPYHKSTGWGTKQDFGLHHSHSHSVMTNMTNE
jgi:hypothetical protein